MEKRIGVEYARAWGFLSHVLVFLVISLLAIASSGWRASESYAQLDRSPKKKAFSTDRSPRRVPFKKQYRARKASEPAWESPLREANNFKEDYGRPEGSTRQHFFWTKVGCEWRLWLARKEDAVAGVRFRRPLDLSSAQRLRKRMVFQLSPHWMGEHLTLGLTQKERTNEGVMLSRPLSDFRAGTRDKWGYFAVTFDAFPPGTTGENALNWEKIAGVKFGRIGNPEKTSEVIIKNVMFEM